MNGEDNDAFNLLLSTPSRKLNEHSLSQILTYFVTLLILFKLASMLLRYIPIDS